jgi:hypothetical protein
MRNGRACGSPVYPTERSNNVPRFSEERSQTWSIQATCATHVPRRRKECEWKQIIVMPRLIHFKEPISDTVAEVLDCFRQIFEVSRRWILLSYYVTYIFYGQGIQFMHQNFVAHRYAPRHLIYELSLTVFKRLRLAQYHTGSRTTLPL